MLPALDQAVQSTQVVKITVEEPKPIEDIRTRTSSDTEDSSSTEESSLEISLVLTSPSEKTRIRDLIQKYRNDLYNAIVGSTIVVDDDDVPEDKYPDIPIQL